MRWWRSQERSSLRPCVRRLRDIAGDGVVVGEHHAALAGGDLFVRIEPECAGVAPASGVDAVERCADGFAGIFDHRDARGARGGGDRLHLGDAAEDIDRDDRAQQARRIRAARRGSRSHPLR